jgi:hypothetical protein
MIPAPVTIRFAHPHDAPALATLAQLDSAEPLDPPVLVAEVGGELRAALSLADAAVMADPFHPTRELLDLLRVRAEQLTTTPAPSLLARLRAASAVFAPQLPQDRA